MLIKCSKNKPEQGRGVKSSPLLPQNNNEQHNYQPEKRPKVSFGLCQGQPPPHVHPSQTGDARQSRGRRQISRKGPCHVSPVERKNAVMKTERDECIERLGLHGFTSVGHQQSDLILMQDGGQWHVKLSPDGLVQNLGCDKKPTDFFTWQLHNTGRLLG